MVMEISRAELDVRIPSVAHELDADDLTPSVTESQRLIENQGGAVNLPNAADLKGFGLIHPHTDQRSGLESVGADQLEAGLAGLGGSRIFSPSLVKGRTEVS